MERIDPTQDGNTPRNWRASIAAASTPQALLQRKCCGITPWITNSQNSTVQAGIPITVTANVQGATSVNLKYIINFGSSVIISMLDDGLNGDGSAGRRCIWSDNPGAIG